MDIKEAIVLVEVNKPYSKNLEVFLNWDWAVLKCAKLNSGATNNQYFHLDRVPLNSDTSEAEVFIDREGDEIIFSNEDGETLYLYIKTSNDVHEERFHEEVLPDRYIVAVVDDVKICGTSISDLPLSDETKRKIEHEAENYKEELNSE